MAPDYSEVLDLWAEQAKHAAASPEAIHALLRESQRGAVVLDELLDSPAWNIFRSNLAGQVQGYDIERTQLRGQVEAGTLVGDERARADLRLQYLRGLLEAFQIALDVPRCASNRTGPASAREAFNGGPGREVCDRGRAPEDQ